MKRFFKLNKIPLLLTLSAALFYASFAYDLDRSDFLKLISLYSGLFFLSWKLIQLKKNSFWFLAGVALVFRLIFLGSIPNLSQDFYRFIWDGRMLLNGFNPFLSVPAEFIAAGEAPVSQAEILYGGMGKLNAGNYTNYPPLHQLIFALAAVFAGKSIIGSVIIMRIIIIAADFGILFFGKRILEKMQLPVHRIFWFILNPFVIIELTGNLHFEGIMLFFLMMSLYLLFTFKWFFSAIAFALSVLVKLLPLMLLPLFFGYFIRRDNDKNNFGWKKLIIYYFIVIAVVIAGFLPFLSAEFLSNFSSSISLWFQKFEFNASFYYVLRWIGFEMKGYNTIGALGKILPVLVMIILLGLTFFRKNSSKEQLITSLLLGASIYFFLSTTVHPWYVATPLLLSVFTRYKFALVWSLLVVLSYYAYSNPGYRENLWLVALEYIIVIGLFIFEINQEKRRATLSSVA